MRLAIALVLAARVAHADETTRDWQSEPRPDQASGIERDDAVPTSERLLWIPRAALFVPRWIVWGVGQPFRGGAWAYDHYDLYGVYKRTFWNDAETFGVYPIVAYESGFGLSGGGRLVHTNLLGHHESLRVRADYGTSGRMLAGGLLHTGDAWSRVGLEVDVAYERRPDETFYGIGDDATMGEVRFSEELRRAVPAVEIEVASPLVVRFASALVAREVDHMVFDEIGGEVQLIYDTRRPAERYASPWIDAAGWRASIYAGKTFGDAADFTSYGGEVQRFFDLYRGTRVLGVRLLVEAIDGEPQFVDLPRLGGSEYLRGYPRGRFRDKAATLASAEYSWELGNYFAAYMFVDAGRVWSSLADVTLADPRLGYGIGVQVHTILDYLGRVQLAASRDGDYTVDVVFTHAFPARKRLGRP
jgi:hypothetical protein